MKGKEKEKKAKCKTNVFLFCSQMVWHFVCLSNFNTRAWVCMVTMGEWVVYLILFLKIEILLIVMIMGCKYITGNLNKWNEISPSQL